MKTIILNNYKYFLSVIIMLFFLLYCDDNLSKNKKISDTNVSILKTLQDSVKLDKKDVVLDNSLRINEIRNSILLLEQTRKTLNDSLNFYTSKLTEIDIRLDDLTKKKSYVSDTDQRAKSKITSNINDLESVINGLKISKSNEEKKLKMIAKRKELISKKNEALKSELEFEQLELNDLYSKTDTLNQIEKVNKKIKEINNEILQNKNLLLEEDLNENLSISKISNLDDQIRTKQNQFKTEYEKSTGIKDYVESEVEDLVYKINNLEIQKSELSQKWKGFKFEKDTVLLKIQNLAVIKNQLLNPNRANIQIDSTKLNKELASADSEKKQNEEQSKSQEIIEENENSTESSESIIYWFVSVIILVIVGLYWLGKKNKKNNSTKDLGGENE